MLVIPRGHGPENQPGRWYPWPNAHGSPTPVLCCPECGAGRTLEDERFQVSADGTVVPSVLCGGALPGGRVCGWHENIRLEGWSP